MALGPAPRTFLMPLARLETSGWAIVEGVPSPDVLLELGRTLGRPVPSPNGELIKEIRVATATDAPPGSQSSIFGTGPFPLHTDTVFWPVPVRYVLLRVRGDTRRPTTVMAFSQLIRDCGERFRVLAERSVWVAGTKQERFYCSLRFRQGDSIGWRYDANLMAPMNDAAIEVDEVLRTLVATGPAHRIPWSENLAVVLSNWAVLHGRGPEPHDEGVRIIERLYVR
jgi:alpha-ketoglutarate-dependent taurine dioxygenase